MVPYVTVDVAFAGGLYGSGLSDHKEYKEPWVSRTMTHFYKST